MQQTIATSHAESYYNATHHKSQYILKSRPNLVSDGTAKRVRNYAEQRLKDAGFGVILHHVEKCEIEAVCSYGGTVTDHTFHVVFTTPEGGEIGVQGIMLSRYGWPKIDHGLHLEG